MFELNSLASIKIGLASSEQIHKWSEAEERVPGSGEVTKPETINYRSLKPEPDGLFAEKIFGPAKDYECYCGKYKKFRYAGKVCEKCGVEVTTKAVRRERMGYINLASPCTHIWYLKGTPSKMALLLDIAPKELEEVVYYQSHIVLNAGTCEALKYKQVLDERFGREIFSQILENLRNDGQIINDYDKQVCESYILSLRDTDQPYDFISTSRFINKYTGAEFGWGADAVKRLLSEVNLEEEFNAIEEELKGTEKDKQNQKRIKLLKRLEVVESLKNSTNRPEWMVLDAIPVIPPDLRPMLQLDGGRFATSDLNDLYRRVIVRNERLKKLLSLKAPSVILVNEQRMLQEAVDSFIDNGRRNKAVTGMSGRALKSLSSNLKGKPGRFRQNLLGKRVDYSGRSVICVGPFLRMDQCGLPREMALQLFRPFIKHELTKEQKITGKDVDKMIDRGDDIVYDILERIVPDHPVLLNRAPTLHRLGIQAFRPVLVDGRAIRLHPLVCPGFNADFDGDQMAIHVPLSKKAQQEAYDLMISTRNILSPRDATVLAIPVQDIVVGHFYLTSEQTEQDYLTQQKGALKHNDPTRAEEFAKYAAMDGHFFATYDDVMKALDDKRIHMNNRIAIPAKNLHKDSFTEEQKKCFLITTVGKLIFNNMFPADFPYINDAPSHNDKEFEHADPKWFMPMGYEGGIKKFLENAEPTVPVSKKELQTIVNQLFRKYQSRRTALLLDRIKDTGYYYCTKLGLTISIDDINLLPGREEYIEQADQAVAQIEDDFNEGMMTAEARHQAIVGVWTNTKNTIQKEVEKYMLNNPRNPVFMMARSGARGSTNNFVQLIGMRGLMSGPNNTILEIPVKDSFRQGMTVSEYFIATHGARKGSTDTALKTADSGYLTRRLVDVSHAVVIREEDCGVDHGFRVRAIYDNNDKIAVTVAERCLGRYSATDIFDNEGNLICAQNTFIDEAIAEKIKHSGLEEVEIRSLLACEAKDGVCIHCYGRNMANGEMAKIGDTVGIMAAQSIGEPGTQLTMRTFHEGGTAGSDITQGLPRVQELLEVRNPKGKATITTIDGEITKIESESDRHERYFITVTNKINDNVQEEKTFTTLYGSKLLDSVVIGAKVSAGSPLTIGSIDPKELLEATNVWKVAKYLIDEVQKVYCAQGIHISDKHIEVIVKKMLGKLLVIDSGDTDLIPGIRTDRTVFTSKNQKVFEHGGMPATCKPVILGVTKAALDTSSFLSSASFQETTRVLTDAALKGRVDYLKGLKENVMIGKLIPAGTGIKALDENEDFVSSEKESIEDFNAIKSPFTETEFFSELIKGYGYIKPSEEELNEENEESEDDEVIELDEGSSSTFEA